MSTANEVLPFGAALRRQRFAAGLSLRDLAQRVHYSKSHLSKIETGRRRPSLDLARQCDAALEAAGELISMLQDEGATGTSAPPSASSRSFPSPAAEEWTLSMDSTGHGGFGVVSHQGAIRIDSVTPVTWALPPAANTGCPERSGIGSFRIMYEQIRRVGHAMAPAALLPVVIAQTNALRLVAIGSKPAVRSEALLLASRFAEYAGWLAQESGDDRGTLWWTDRAVEFAGASGDRDLAAYALVRRGLVAMYRYDARETIAVAKQAQEVPCGPRVRGLAALREAQGHALAGDYSRCRRALDRGATLLSTETATRASEPLLGSSTVANLTAMVTGWCLHDLGRSRQAIDYLAAELASVPDHANRTRARIGARYSLALVAAGELEEGCKVVAGLLEGITLLDSATARVDLRRLAQELNRRGNRRAVKSVMPRLMGALSTAYR